MSSAIMKRESWRDN